MEQAERKSDILTNLLKEASAEFSQALDKVSKSEANFRAIIESAPEAISPPMRKVRPCGASLAAIQALLRCLK